MKTNWEDRIGFLLEMAVPVISSTPANHERMHRIGLLLCERLSEPERFYHNGLHTLQVTETVMGLSEYLGIESPDRKLLIVAALFHDAVYHPTRTDSEERSVEMSHRLLSGTSFIDNEDLVEYLILGTKLSENRPLSTLGNILADADIANLGSDYPTFAENGRLIMMESSPYMSPIQQWAGRVAFCNMMLRRSQIYRLPIMQDLYEEQARMNLRFAKESAEQALLCLEE